MKALVSKAIHTGGDSILYSLVPTGEERWPQFLAGDHIALSFEVPGQGRQTRQYSLINPTLGTGPERYDFVIQREPAGRGGSVWLHSNLLAGTMIEIEGPFSHFQLDASTRPALFIAGGIGITPLLAMARMCQATARPFDLHAFARSPSAPLRDEARQLRGGNIAFHDGLNAADASVRLAAILRAHPARPPIHVCGPQGFMDATLATARALGWPDEDLRSERFAPISHALDKAFQVRLAASDRTITVAGDQSLLAALSAHGISVASSCGAGICGSCLVSVVAGNVDHRDSFLSDDEKAQQDLMCICVSRAAGEHITIDL